jgi:hypothetical protein
MATAVAEGPLHPAARAWQTIDRYTPGHVIETIKDKKGSGVYRLVGVHGGSNVIAKRRTPEGAPGLLVERALYRDVLPQLGIPTLQYFGLVEHDGATWLFVEDAGPGRYSPESPGERKLLGAWLGRVHTAGTEVARGLHLPERGPVAFHAHLVDGRQRIIQHRENPALNDEERSILHELLRLLDLVESRWGEVEAFCAGMPRVLVHGDLIARNVCVRMDAGALAIIGIDWEKAGWGVPSIDLAQAPIPSTLFAGYPDVNAYSDAVRHVWPHLDAGTLESSAWFATIFRCLAAIHWDARYVRLVWPHRTMAKMAYYRTALTVACDRVGWEAPRG